MAPEGQPATPAPTAPASTAAKPPPAPPKERFIERRTLRGLGVALGVAAVVLLHYHVLRPFLFHHQIRTSADEDVVSMLKAVLAFSSIGLLVWSLVRRLQKRPFSPSTIRTAFIVCGALGVVAYVGSDELGATYFVHKWELFHYYLGSKYPKELGYKRIYVCAAVAEAELGPAARAEAESRKIRDLNLDMIVPAGPILEHPEACKDHFTADRWAAFRRDIAWFRSTSNKEFWEGMSTDHGYNPPPVWTMIGHEIGAFFPVASSFSMTFLASIDAVLFALLFFAVWWAFGLETCALVLVFWGTEHPANGYFTGGAFLRQDWLLLLVLAACFLRKRYWGLAGASLAASTLLRVFPVFFFAGIGVVAATHYLKHKRFAKHHLRVFAGAAVATVLLGAAGAAVAGPESYVSFVDHIRHHEGTAATNNMGLRALLSFTPEGRADLTRDPSALDEFGKWGEAHTKALERRRPAYLAFNAFIGLVFVLALRRVKTLWVAMGLSGILIVTVIALSSYYYAFFLVPALLGKVSFRLRLLTLFAAGMSAVLIPIGRISFQFDDRYTLQSLVFLGYAFALIVAFLPPNRERAPRTDSQAPAGSPSG